MCVRGSEFKGCLRLLKKRKFETTSLCSSGVLTLGSGIGSRSLGPRAYIWVKFIFSLHPLSILL